MEQAESPRQIRQDLKLGLQSFAIFLISYHILYLISGLSVLYIAYDFDIPAQLFLNKIVFSLEDTDHRWTNDAIISILMATPVISFVMGITAVLSFLVVPAKKAIHLYFVIWFFLLAFNMTFGLLSENILSQTGLIRVAQTMGIHPVMLTVTVGVSFFLMVKSGIFSGKLFYHHHCKPQHNTALRLQKGIFFFLLPWLLGNGIILLTERKTIETKDFVLTLFMLLLIVPAVLAPAPENAQQQFGRPKALMMLLAMAAAVVFSAYQLLQHGLSF